MLGRIACLFGGHQWRLVAMNLRRHGLLVNLYTFAGMLVVCRRCQRIINDLDPGATASTLAVARVVRPRR